MVRITAKTEKSDSTSDADGLIDVTPLFYPAPNVVDSGSVTIPPGCCAGLTITSLAVTPAGSRRMVSTLWLCGSGAAFASFPSA